MLVKDCMTKHPLMVEPTMPVLETQRYMAENNVRHLPVIGKGKRLLGLVSRQTLLIQPAKLDSLDVWEISRFLSNLTIREVMVKVKEIITIEKDETIEEAARIMVENNIGCLPVLEESIVVGILTEINLLSKLMEMVGAREPGLRVTVRNLPSAAPLLPRTRPSGMRLLRFGMCLKRRSLLLWGRSKGRKSWTFGRRRNTII
jgi:acetoin utilization protein AcuB